MVSTVNHTSAGGKVIFPRARTANHPRATDGGAQQDRTTKRIPCSLADSLDFSFFFAVAVPFIKTQLCWLTGTDVPLSLKITETCHKTRWPAWQCRNPWTTVKKKKSEIKLPGVTRNRPGFLTFNQECVSQVTLTRFCSQNRWEDPSVKGNTMGVVLDAVTFRLVACQGCDPTFSPNKYFWNCVFPYMVYPFNQHFTIVVESRDKITIITGWHF